MIRLSHQIFACNCSKQTGRETVNGDWMVWWGRGMKETLGGGTVKHFKALMSWAPKWRRLKVRANGSPWGDERNCSRHDWREREMCVFGQNVLMFDRCQNSFVVIGGTFCSSPLQNRNSSMLGNMKVFPLTHLTILWNLRPTVKHQTITLECSWSPNPMCYQSFIK